MIVQTSNTSGPVYYTGNGLFKFDTTSIPAGATIISASLALYVTGITNVDSLTCKIDWYSSNTTADFTATDYTDPSNVSGTAASRLMSSFTSNATNSITLSNLTNIVKGGYTAFRMAIPYSGTPTGSNSLQCSTTDAASNKPVLTVIYDQPPTAPTLTSPNGGETWNASQTITWNAATDPDTSQASLQYNIDVSTDGGTTWAQVVALTSAGATSYNYDFSSVAQSSNCRVRIRAYDGALYGPYAQSAGVFTIQHNLAPTAPTLLAPDSGTPKDRAQSIHLSWQHNDPNLDPQAKFDLMYSSDGGNTWTTVTQTTVNQYYDVPANTLPHGNVLWKVRTYDPGGLSGPYSNQETFLAGDKPANPTVTAPTGTIAIASPNIQWSSVGQSSYEIQILNNVSAVIWDTNEVVSTNLAQTAGIALANSSTFTVQVRIKNADGLWSNYATSSITTSFTLPAAPTAVVSTNTGYISVSASNPTPTGSQPTVNANDIYRQNLGDTSWVRIAASVPANTTYNDYAVASGQVYQYKVTALGTNGTFLDSPTYPGSLILKGIWLHNVASPSSSLLNIPYNTNRKETWKPEVQFMKFAGRKNAVSEFGESEDLDFAADLKMKLPQTTWLSLRSLARAKAILCARDYRGRKIFGVIASLPEVDDDYGQTITLDIVQVDYTEAV
ncbi:MAG: hypothetical protein Q8911_00005 [Bacillota bacterium]|nr:hypothetical protein [Bacillota bacterium]